METKKVVTETKTLLAEFLTQMGLDAEIKVELSDTDNSEQQNLKYVNVKLEGEHLNEIVGYHGRNLDAAQTVLGLILSKRLNSKDYRMVIEINDYKERREKYLVSYAERAALQVRDSGQELELPPMKPSERRVIHMALKKEEGIETKSIGEGEERRIVISRV